MAEFYAHNSRNGLTTSPGGFEFGVQGFVWSDPKPMGITFFLDGTAVVRDQYGRPVRGAMLADGTKLEFATTAPELPDGRPAAQLKRLATHAQVIAAITEERIDWQKLDLAGWPQLPYDQLKQVRELPPTPTEELGKIKHKQLRKDALRARREFDEVRMREMAAENEDDVPQPTSAVKG